MDGCSGSVDDSDGDVAGFTIGWVVMLQVGVVVLDAIDGAPLPPTKLAAIGLMLLLQAYLIGGDILSS